jgi:hypothetical protein
LLHTAHVLSLYLYATCSSLQREAQSRCCSTHNVTSVQVLVLKHYRATHIGHTTTSTGPRPLRIRDYKRSPNALSAARCQDQAASVATFRAFMIMIPTITRTTPSNTTKLATQTVLHRNGGLKFAEGVSPSSPLCVQSAESKMSANDMERRRRRRSSSLMYQEPPESLEHQSDQMVNPNLNAQWVNAKGMNTL